MNELKKDQVPTKKPRKFNRIAAATAIGVLIGIIMSYVTGKNDYAVILGTGIGALVGFTWDWLATRNSGSPKE